ncbi:hypothetical protein RQ80_18160, partial [Acinetobacter baumannii]
MAQEAVSQLPTIHTKATQEESLKVDQSANSKFVAPLKDTPKSVSIRPLAKVVIASSSDLPVQR